jgi:hypothetical protein
MRKLPRPTQNAGAVYTLCIGRVRNRLLRTRLTSVTVSVTTAAGDYATHATAATLQLIARSNAVGYFDDFEDERWLAASVVQSTPAAFLFFIVAPVGYTPQTVARLRRHMTVFSLEKLFASNAAEELVNIRFGLQKVFDAGGAAGVRTHLKGEADSREAAFKNSWQTAMYRAAEASDWFCNGGFAVT